MSKRWLILVVLLLLVSGFVAAEAEEEEASGTEAAAGTGGETLRDKIRRILRLPRTAEDSREAGVSEGRVREILEAARTRRVPADEMQRILVVETEEVRRGGKPENFGAVVQELKAQGLRGRELAEAIHAEQIARGMKKPKPGHDMKGSGRKEPGKSKGKGKGKR